MSCEARRAPHRAGLPLPGAVPAGSGLGQSAGKHRTSAGSHPSPGANGARRHSAREFHCGFSQQAAENENTSFSGSTVCPEDPAICRGASDSLRSGVGREVASSATRSSRVARFAPAARITTRRRFRSGLGYCHRTSGPLHRQTTAHGLARTTRNRPAARLPADSSPGSRACPGACCQHLRVGPLAPSRRRRPGVILSSLRRQPGRSGRPDAVDAGNGRVSRRDGPL